MQFLNILKIILSLFPLLLQMVDAAEAAFPQSGQGATKLGLVKQTLQSAYGVAQSVEVPFEQLWSVASTLITSIVAAKNALKPTATEVAK